MTKRRTLALGAAAALAAIAVAATASAGNPNTLTLAVYGDSPYFEIGFAKNAEYLATPAFIDTINADPSVQDVIHVGDIHSGNEACTVAYDQAIFDLWQSFERPLIYTPGDNEWSDCTKTKELSGTDVFGNGPDFNGDPLQHLALVRSTFFANPGWTLGQNPMQVDTQGPPYVENVMWEQSKTLFVTVNIPGGSTMTPTTGTGLPETMPRRPRSVRRVPPPTSAGSKRPSPRPTPTTHTAW